jgi:hypothetical protein
MALYGTHLVVEQFFDEAEAMRAAFESHFANPGKHSLEHQVWNYWYFPDSYTYLRTIPGKVMPEPLVSRFRQRLNEWGMATLGMCCRPIPWLSLYIDGCGQTIHNDATNGQMGFVYSLTRWGTHNFLGGETLLFRPEHYWETERIRSGGAGEAFYEKVPPRFNQLLVFDDRVIHGVQPIQGTMDPVAGRLVIHGHLKADGAMLTGALRPEPAFQAISPTLDRLRGLARDHGQLFHGFMTFRLAIDPNGRVTEVKPLCDRVLPVTPDKSRLEPLRQDVIGLLAGAVFPAAAGPSELTLPILIGGS